MSSGERRVASRMPMSSAPFTRRAISTAVSSSPTTVTSAGRLARWP